MTALRLTCLTLSALSLSSMASAQNVRYEVYDFRECVWDITDKYGNVNQNANLYGYFNHVSANGKYAVGTDEELMKRAFFWCADRPDELDMLGESDFEIVLYDVTNDGTVVGGIRNQQGMMYPAYKPLDANWQVLTRGMERLNQAMATTGNVQMGIRAVTPDGSYMAGSFYINTGRYGDDGTMIAQLLPVVWKDGKLQRIYDDIGIREFMVWDISDDGSIICGSNTAGIGGFNPSFIRDGKLYQLFECGDERNYFTPDDVYANTAGGICNNIDNQGNIYGYYSESEGDMANIIMPFVVPAGSDYAVFLDPAYTNAKFPAEYWDLEWYVCGGNGARYTRDDAHLYSLLDCSDDGKVFVGGGAFNLGFGLANIPQICIYDQPLSPAALPAVADACLERGIIFTGRTVIVKGLYQQACLYNAQGALVSTAPQGQPIPLPGAGPYVVTVAYPDGLQSFKLSL